MIDYGPFGSELLAYGLVVFGVIVSDMVVHRMVACSVVLPQALAFAAFLV